MFKHVVCLVVLSLISGCGLASKPPASVLYLKYGMDCADVQALLDNPMKLVAGDKSGSMQFKALLTDSPVPAWNSQTQPYLLTFDNTGLAKIELDKDSLLREEIRKIDSGSNVNPYNPYGYTQPAVIQNKERRTSNFRYPATAP